MYFLNAAASSTKLSTTTNTSLRVLLLPSAAARSIKQYYSTMTATNPRTDLPDDEVQETIRTVVQALPPTAVIEGSPESYYRNIFLENRPMLDVRSTVEFVKGAFPTSVNFPLLNDEYRQLVGTCYKTNGHDAAVALGAQLVSGAVKADVIESWKGHVMAHPDSYLYCFRGGLRSRISVSWITQAIHEEHGAEQPPPPIPYAPPPIIAGGYKAMRNYLMQEIQRSVAEFPIILVAGRSATGKTHLLTKLSRHIDLEGIAKHRGSAFGSLVEEQPSQINFENTLAIEFLKLGEEEDGRRCRPIFIEDEGPRIGLLFVPGSLTNAMQNRYPLVVVETSREERAKTCVYDYVTTLVPQFTAEYGNVEGLVKYRAWFLGSLQKAKKKLGGPRYREIHAQLAAAIDILEQDPSADDKDRERGFYKPLGDLLEHVYDPQYDYQLSARKGEVLFRGDENAVREWAETYIANYKVSAST